MVWFVIMIDDTERNEELRVRIDDFLHTHPSITLGPDKIQVDGMPTPSIQQTGDIARSLVANALARRADTRFSGMDRAEIFRRLADLRAKKDALEAEINAGVAALAQLDETEIQLGAACIRSTDPLARFASMQELGESGSIINLQDKITPRFELDDYQNPVSPSFIRDADRKYEL